MNLLKEFFASVSIPMLVLVVAVFVLVWVLVRCFRFPPGFAVKEEFRDEIRFRLFDEHLAEATAKETKKVAAATEAPPDTAAMESESA